MSLETAKLLKKTHHLATTKYAMLTTTPFLTAPYGPFFPQHPLDLYSVWESELFLVLHVYLDVCVRDPLCTYILISS